MIFYPIVKRLCNRSIINGISRFVSTENYTKVLVPLKSRKLMKVSGKDASCFLQGLITNDMGHFNDGAKSIYAMFLNNKGRVLFDTLIYKWEGDKTFIIECDQAIYFDLLKHLSLYRLKRNVKIEDINKTFNIWALISPAVAISDCKLDTESPINMFEDPRLAELGCRILSMQSFGGQKIINMLGHKGEAKVGDEEVYKYLRYNLGVGEGAEDLQPGISFPLEANCDYLHGVSFHKGCYLGQELTARIYHTGVVRKRLMPIKFQSVVEEYIDKDTVVTDGDNPKSNLGKLKGYIHDHGLGLLRIKEALEAKTIKVGNSMAEVAKPFWWPREAPKDKDKLTSDKLKLT